MGIEFYRFLQFNVRAEKLGVFQQFRRILLAFLVNYVNKKKGTLYLLGIVPKRIVDLLVNLSKTVKFKSRIVFYRRSRRYVFKY